jgi:hypothetical protein
MAKYSEIVALLEYFDKKSVRPPTKRGRGKMFKDKDFDPVDYIRKEEERLDRWKKFLKDKEKLDKKDEPDKEDPKRSFQFLEWFIIGMLSYPIIGPLWHMVVK